MAPAGETEAFVDYYDLLSISASATESEIRRAYRKTSLLYHPDKVKQTPETLDKFQLLQVAINILTDAAEKSKYDQTREAKQRRITENAALEERRRKMKEDLEKRETNTNDGKIPLSTVNGVKRTWSERELDIKRIAEENRRKREAIVQERAKQAREAQAAEAKKDEEKPADTMERSVKVRWLREGNGLEIDNKWLSEACERYGKVENVLVLKDRKRIEGRDKKVVVGSALVVFASLIAAKKAVVDMTLEGIESISWAAEKETEPS
jgi:DnaJ homolog subfamily C member 17